MGGTSETRNRSELNEVSTFMRLPGRGEICRLYRPEMRRGVLAPIPRVSQSAQSRLTQDILVDIDGLSANRVLFMFTVKQGHGYEDRNEWNLELRDSAGPGLRSTALNGERRLLHN